jgi:tRNA threonylcarbamoyladenosine biosynthesis protein TsaB
LSPPPDERLLLAIETSTEVGGVALARGEALLGEVTLGEDASYNAALMPAIDHLLGTCGRRLDEVDAIALSVGPGSFTGLRVGLATALGLCFGTDRVIVPVPTLAALSLHAGDAPRTAPLLDARKGQVYAGLYGPEGEPLAADLVTDPLPWLETLKGTGPLVLLGPGAHLYRNEIETVLGHQARLLPPLAGWPRPAPVASLGERLRARGEARRPEDVDLCYVRPAEAEEIRRKRLAGHARKDSIS